MHLVFYIMIPILCLVKRAASVVYDFDDPNIVYADKSYWPSFTLSPDYCFCGQNKR